MPSYSNAIRRDPWQKHGERPSILDWGAIGDGVADDTAAFQSAFSALKSGSEIQIPFGKYLISDTLVIPTGVRITGKSGKRPDNASLSSDFGSQIIGHGITFLEISNPSGSYSGGDTVIDSLIFTDLTGHDDTIMIDVIGYLGGVEITDCVLRSPTLSAGVGIRGKGIGIRLTSVDNTFLTRTRVYGFNRGVILRAASSIPCTSFSINDCLIVGNNINIESPYEGGSVGIGNGLISGGAIQFPWDANISYKGNSLTLNGVHIENFNTQTVGGELRKATGIQVLSGTLVTQGCDFYQPPQDETFHGDGAAREFTLAYNQIAEPIIYVNGTRDTSVKVDDVGGTVTGADWYWLNGGKRIRQDAGETALIISDTLEVVYPDEYCRSVDVGYAAAGNVVYQSISDEFVGCVASINPTPTLLVHPRQATAYNPYLFIQHEANVIRHDVTGINGPAAQDQTYTVEALETRHAARPGGEAILSLQKKGDLGADNIRYNFSHRSNGRDLWLYSRDSDSGSPVFKNWVKVNYQRNQVEIMGLVDDRSLLYYGAIPDATELTDAAISSGTKTLTATGLGAGDEGKVVCVNGAGTAGGPLVTTIASVNGPGSVEVADNASTTVGGAAGVFGTDNATAIAAFLAACHSKRMPFYIPSGWFLTTAECEFEGGNIEIRGDGRDNSASSVIVYVGTGSAVFIHPPVGTYYCYAASITHLGIACYGGAASAIRLVNVSQADYFRVGLNQLNGASCGIGWDCVNPNIIRIYRPITQNCGAAYKISSTGSPDSATNFHIHGGNLYRNGSVLDLRANLVKFTIDGLCHIEQFTDLVKLNRGVGAADLQINSLTIDDCEITASTGGYVSKLLNITVPGDDDLIIGSLKFTRNWVFFGEPSPAQNPMQFTFGGVGTVTGEMIVEDNEFSYIDTSLIDCNAPGIPAFKVHWNNNRKRFGSDFVPLSAASTALLYQDVSGGDLMTGNTALVRSKAGGFVAPITGLEWLDEGLRISRDPDATKGQFEVSDAAYSRVVRLSVPASTYTAILKFAGGLAALGINGLVTVGSDEQPPTTLYVHDNSLGGHTQFQVKANAADGSSNAILNILNTSAASALQVMGNGDAYFPLVAGGGNVFKNGGGGKVTTGGVDAADITGVLGVAHGGTGETTLAGLVSAIASILDDTFATISYVTTQLGDYYTKTQTDYQIYTAINALSDSIATALAGKADTAHSHTVNASGTTSTDAGHNHTVSVTGST